MDATLSIALAVTLPAFAVGLMGYGAFTAMGRNPAAAKDIKGSLILALAFAEGLGLIAALLIFTKI